MNESERVVKAMLEARDFRVLRNGWPDFLCIREVERSCGVDMYGNTVVGKIRGIMAVEVKAGKDKLSQEQRIVHTALQAARIPVFVVRPNEANANFKTRHFLTNREIEHLGSAAEVTQSKIKKLKEQVADLERECVRIEEAVRMSSVVLGDAKSMLETDFFVEKSAAVVGDDPYYQPATYLLPSGGASAK